MVKKSLVTIHGTEGRAGTKIIADGFNRKHDQIKRMVTKYQVEFEEIAPLKGAITKGKTKSFEEFLLTQDQFLFLGSLLRNNDQIVRFKLNLVKEFSKCRKLLESALGQRGDLVYDQARLTAKTLRKLETGEIQQFIAYAKEQGGSVAGCDMYYANITKMMNGLLFICEGRFKNLRDILTPEQLMTVGSAEQVISKSLRDDMANNVFYKEIYKNLKTKVELFAELHGQSEVISRQLLLEHGAIK